MTLGRLAVEPPSFRIVSLVPTDKISIVLMSLSPYLLHRNFGALAGLLCLATPSFLSGELALVPSASQPRDEAVRSQEFRQQIEEDWLRQAKAIEEGSSGAVTKESDARGGCDGIKDGKYGFQIGRASCRERV